MVYFGTLVGEGMWKREVGGRVSVTWWGERGVSFGWCVWVGGDGVGRERGGGGGGKGQKECDAMRCE